jgi:hypothetical protein
MKLEQLWYELSPYVYASFGGYALALANNKMAYISASLLISAAMTIVMLRRHYRGK